MTSMIVSWFRRHFSDPDAIILFFALIFAVVIFITMGKFLMPVFTSIVIAYLLQSLVAFLERYKTPHWLAVILVYSIFLSLLIFALLGLLPLLWHQLTNLFNELPIMLNRGQAMIMNFTQQYPDYISLEQLQSLLSNSKLELGRLWQFFLTAILASIPGIIALTIYLVLVPLLIYFFLMDRKAILVWLKAYLPARRRLLTQVWEEVHEQIGNYVRGKVIEVIIVGVTCYVMFLIMGMPYAALLSALIGLSVIVPYIGAVVVTIPVVIIAFLQWGWSAHFAYLIVVYTIIITLDANVLVPLLFSGAVSLHPTAIIIAILFFGGLWGFWGVFFAIPLASLVKAVLSAWPRNNDELMTQ